MAAVAVLDVLCTRIHPTHLHLGSTQDDQLHVMEAVPLATPWSGVTYRELWPEYLAWVEQRCQGRTPVMLAHNGVGFDMQILEAHCQSLGMEIPNHWLWVDSVVLARWLTSNTEFKCPAGNTLAYLNVHFELPEEVAHQASGDTMMTVRVFKELLALLPPLSGTPAEAGDTMTRRMAAAAENRTHAWAGTWQSRKLRGSFHVLLVPAV